MVDIRDLDHGYRWDKFLEGPHQEDGVKVASRIVNALAK